MKTGGWLLVLLCLGTIGVATAVTHVILKSKQPEEIPGDVPMISSEHLQDAAVVNRSTGQMLAVIMVGFSLFLQLVTWWAAVRKFREVEREDMGFDARFMHLAAIEVYFDLPLYFGLLGTVLSFLLVTVYPEAGLMFAYVSTALGIVVSVILRLAYMTPYKQRLIQGR